MELFSGSTQITAIEILLGYNFLRFTKKKKGKKNKKGELLQPWPVYDPGSHDVAQHTLCPTDQSAQKSQLCNFVITCTGVIFCYLSILHLEMEPEDPHFQQHLLVS